MPGSIALVLMLLSAAAFIKRLVQCKRYSLALLEEPNESVPDTESYMDRFCNYSIRHIRHNFSALAPIELFESAPRAAAQGCCPYIHRLFQLKGGYTEPEQHIYNGAVAK